MIRYDLNVFVETQDAQDIAIICNIAFKAIFSVYKDLLSLQVEIDPSAAHQINQRLIAKSIDLVREIKTNLPNDLVPEEGFDALVTYLRAAMLDAELNAHRSFGKSI